MRSYPSMTESLEKQLDRYEKEYDQSDPGQNKHCLQRSFIDVFPAHAKAEIESQIKETEKCLAKIVADSVRDKILWDFPDNECSSLPEPLCVAPRKAPRSGGGGKIFRSVQAIIKHYSGATIEEVVLRELLEKVFGAMRSGNGIETEQSCYTLCEAVRDTVLKHWTVDKSFFEAIPKPTDHVTLGFWDRFLRHGFLLRRLKLAEAQSEEAMDLEPHLTEVLKLRGREPLDFFRVDSGIQEPWRAEARRRYSKARANPKDVTAKKPESQARKLGWHGSRIQLLQFFRFAFDPDADQSTVEFYFDCSGSGGTIPESAPRLRTRLSSNQLRYFFKCANDMRWLNLDHRDVVLARFCLDRNGHTLNVARLAKKRLIPKSGSIVKEKIDAKILDINAVK